MNDNLKKVIAIAAPAFTLIGAALTMVSNNFKLEQLVQEALKK